MKEIRGDLFSQKADAICVTTNGELNSRGEAIMGRGCALEAKQRWPFVVHRLGNRISMEGNKVFRLTDNLKRLLFSDPPLPYHLFSFPTKNKWREPASLSLIEESCRQLRALTPHLAKVVLPRPGCANGGLDWAVVQPVVAQILIEDRYYIISPLEPEDL